jgi:hypothetical protein
MGVCAKARAAEAPARKLFHSIGSNGKLDQAETYQKQGLDFITGATSDFLVPDKGDEVFAKNLEQLAQSPLPVYACNGFIRPANLRCVGAEANHDQILEWADIAFRRLKQAKGHFMVFGSGGSRALRDGFPAWDRSRDRAASCAGMQLHHSDWQSSRVDPQGWAPAGACACGSLSHGLRW